MTASARAARPLDVQHARVGELDLDAVLLGQRRAEHLLLHLAVQRHGGPALVVEPGGDQRVLVGQVGECHPQRRPQRGVDRLDRRLEGRRGEVVLLGPQRLAEPVTHPHGVEPVQSADPAGSDLVGPHPPTALEHLQAADLADSAVREVEPLPRPDRATEHPDVGDLLPRRTPLHLEHATGRLARRVGRGGGQQARDAGHQLRDTGSRDGRAREDRMQEPLARLGGDVGEQLVRRTLAALDVRREEPVVVLGKGHELPLAEAAVVGAVRRERRCPRAQAHGRAHGQDVGGQSTTDRVEDPVDVGSGAVDLVDEHQRRHPEPLQGTHQDPGLRLDTLDRGQHEHRAVEHAEDPFDLGDEVGVARGVDDVHGDVVPGERHDRGLDRDAATALEREAVGLGGAGVDRPGLVDHSCEVQEPFGESGLTGVDVGEDAQVQ